GMESGTIYGTAAFVWSARHYWIPSAAVSGQGRAAVGFGAAGASCYVDAATTGRLASAPLGTVNAPTLITASSTSYNPPGDPGGSRGRRWGDYSFTSVDPGDDMTMWTIQEFCAGIDTYGVEVAKLVAPPPATPSSASSTVPRGHISPPFTLTGPSVPASA